jgi:hypothetical protein
MEAPKTETQTCAFGPPGPWLPTAHSGAQKCERTLAPGWLIHEL